MADILIAHALNTFVALMRIFFTHYRQGPALLHTPLQTWCALRLLYTPAQQTRQTAKGQREARKVAASKVSMTVPLGQYLEKVDQLRAVTDLLWSNATAMSTQKLNFRYV